MYFFDIENMPDIAPYGIPQETYNENKHSRTFVSLLNSFDWETFRETGKYEDLYFGPKRKAREYKDIYCLN